MPPPTMTMSRISGPGMTSELVRRADQHHAPVVVVQPRQQARGRAGGAYGFRRLPRHRVLVREVVALQQQRQAIERTRVEHVADLRVDLRLGVDVRAPERVQQHAARGGRERRAIALADPGRETAPLEIRLETADRAGEAVELDLVAVLVLRQAVVRLRLAGDQADAVQLGRDQAAIQGNRQLEAVDFAAAAVVLRGENAEVRIAIRLLRRAAGREGRVVVREAGEVALGFLLVNEAVQALPESREGDVAAPLEVLLQRKIDEIRAPGLELGLAA